MHMHMHVHMHMHMRMHMRVGMEVCASLRDVHHSRVQQRERLLGDGVLIFLANF